MKKIVLIPLAVGLGLMTASCGISGNAATAGSMAVASENVQEMNDEKAKKNQKADMSFGTFATEDFEGNKVTEAYFGNADVTIVHVWATYCGSCLAEMEEYGKMTQSLPENVQVLGLCIDVNSQDAYEKELAEQILSDNNVKMTNVIVNNDFDGPLSNVVGVPTTYIVDREGNIVGEPDFGEGVNGYKAMVMDYLETLK